MNRSSATLGIAVVALLLAGPGLKAQQPGVSPPGAVTGADLACSPTCKVCVSEIKHNTKPAFACMCEEYCLPRCSLIGLWWGKCCGEGDACCELRVRHRLVVKKVDACDTKICVVREVPLCPPPAASPGTK